MLTANGVLTGLIRHWDPLHDSWLYYLAPIEIKVSFEQCSTALIQLLIRFHVFNYKNDINEEYEVYKFVSKRKISSPSIICDKRNPVK